jgi:hypothetical protein
VCTAQLCVLDKVSEYREGKAESRHVCIPPVAIHDGVDIPRQDPAPGAGMDEREHT